MRPTRRRVVDPSAFPVKGNAASQCHHGPPISVPIGPGKRRMSLRAYVSGAQGGHCSMVMVRRSWSSWRITTTLDHLGQTLRHAVYGRARDRPWMRGDGLAARFRSSSSSSISPSRTCAQSCRSWDLVPGFSAFHVDHATLEIARRATDTLELLVHAALRASACVARMECIVESKDISLLLRRELMKLLMTVHKFFVVRPRLLGSIGTSPSVAEQRRT